MLEDGQPVGIITRAEVVQALSRNEAACTVTAVMKPVELRIDVTLPLDEVRQLMSDHNVRVAAVFDGAEYRGLVRLEDLAEAYPLAALRRREALPEGGTA